MRLYIKNIEAILNLPREEKRKKDKFNASITWDTDQG